MKRLSPNEKARIFRLHEKGYSNRAISEKVGCHEVTVGRVLISMRREKVRRTGPDGRDIRSLPLQIEAIEKDKPPKRYVRDLYPKWAQEKHEAGTLTRPERIRLSRDVPAIKALWSFRFFVARYESVTLAPHQLAWIAFMLIRQFACVFAPPASGKSYLFSVFLPEWLLSGGGHRRPYYLNPDAPLRNAQVLLVSKSSEQAKKNLTAIKARLEGNEKLLEDYGRFKRADLMWQMDRCIVDGREMGRLTGDASIQVVGAASAVLGFRADWIIVDDFADTKNCTTPEAADDLMLWLSTEVFTRLNDNGRIFVIMARLPLGNDPSVQIEKLPSDIDDETSPPLFSVMASPAVTDWDTKTLLWSPREGQGFLRWGQIKAMQGALGRVAFESVYQQTPFTGAASLAQRAWIFGEGEFPGCVDRDRDFGVTRPYKRRPDDDEPVQMVRVMSVDPSPTKFTAAFCLDLPKVPGEYRPVLLDIARDKLSSTNIMDLIWDWYKRYAFRVLIFEANAAQRWLLQTPEFQSFQRQTHVRVIPHQTTGQNKPDPDYGKQTLARDIEQGFIRIPYGDVATRAKFDILIRELLEEVPTDDTIMALWFPKWSMNGLHLGGGGNNGGGGYPGKGPPQGPPPRLSGGSHDQMRRLVRA